MLVFLNALDLRYIVIWLTNIAHLEQNRIATKIYMSNFSKIWTESFEKYIKIHDKITLFNLVKKLKVPINKVAIEINHSIANKKSLSKIKIKKNDKIEIVHFIGGG